MKETSEHTRSYYAATVNRVTDYPRLEGELHCDVAVVGAGFTGVSAALRLAELGYDVVMLEACRIGWGASGRNGGQLIDGFVDIERIERRLGAEAAKIVQRINVECGQIVVDNIERYKIECDFKRGFIDVATKPRDIAYFHEVLAYKKATDYPHEMEFVPREELKKFVGSDKYIAGLVNRGNGHLHPLNLCIGEACAAEELGVRIFEQSPVSRIRHGENPRIETAHGIVNAKKVVLAGNAYLGKTEPRLAGMVIPAGSFMIATEPLDAALAHELLPQDMAVCDQRIGLDYFRLSPDKRMLFGGLCNYSGRIPEDIAATLRPKMVRAFPQLESARIDYEWGGNIAISVFRIPQLGRIEGNTYYAQGYSGHGVAPTHMAGHMLAEMIDGNPERFAVFEGIKHLRLPGGKWFANPALAIGMGYHRFKDLF
jgi:glycine/D-amino acid oxidase-like deaminating enzyme